MKDSLSRILGIFLMNGIWSRWVIFHKSWSQNEGPVKKELVYDEELRKVQTAKAGDNVNNNNHNDSFHWPREVSEKQLA
jgi:hypothetical protein